MFKEFHFHIYYTASQMEDAKKLIDQLPTDHRLKVGRMHSGPVGPHPIGSCQITVDDKSFYFMICWFVQNRGGLDLFIHPVTGDFKFEHTDGAMWLGRSYELNLGFGPR